MTLTLLAVAVLTVTNGPASFSTMTEQTFACPTLPAKDAWMVFDLDLRTVGSRRAEYYPCDPLLSLTLVEELRV